MPNPDEWNEIPIPDMFKTDEMKSKFKERNQDQADLKVELDEMRQALKRKVTTAKEEGA